MTALIVICGAILACCAAWLAAANASAVHPERVAAPLERRLEQGRVYYAQLCMDCHGARGDGQGEWAYRVSPRPTNLRGARVRAKDSSREEPGAYNKLSLPAISGRARPAGGGASP